MYASNITGFLLLLTLSILAAAVPCGSPFFDLTVENFEASGVANYYASWAANASRTSGFTSSGEVKYFFQDHLGAKDIDCGVSRMGCTGLPTCEGILDSVGDAEAARRIYFIGRVLDNMSLFAGLIYVSPLPDHKDVFIANIYISSQRATTDAQIDTSNLLPAATETFFWQPDPKNERLCKFLGQATKDLIGFSIAMSVTLFPPLLAPAAGAQIVQYSLPWGRMALGNALSNPWIATSLQMFPGSVNPFLLLRS
jgi:hypothetical protein